MSPFLSSITKKMPALKLEFFAGIVTIFVSLSCTESSLVPDFPLALGQCPSESNSQALSNFEPDKFFSGSWHEMRNKGNFLFQLGDTCLGMNSKMENGAASVVVYRFNAVANDWVSIYGLVSDPNIATYELQLFTSGLQVKLPIKVLYADSEYTCALVYSCQNVPSLIPFFRKKLEIVWVLNRGTGLTSPCDSVIKSKLGAIGITYSDMNVLINNNCSSDIPEPI